MNDHLHALPPGYQLDEYRIERVIGSGGFGITYYAWDTHLDKPVALKEYLPNEFAVRVDETTVRPKSSSDQNDYQWGLERFLDEARTLARFKHPNLNQVYRFFEHNGTAYLVLEYIEGETLSALLKREGRLDGARLWRLFHELLAGIEEVHRAGFVHRDIKPGNIMLRQDGSAVLLDFGAARQAIGQRSKSVTSILTPGYAPIEQYDQKADDVGPWTDLYALGMVAYRCISGIRDGELLDAVARARLERKGELDKDLVPAVQIGRGRYDEPLLKAVDWSIKVDEGLRPQDVAALEEMLAGGATSSAGEKPAEPREPLSEPAETPPGKSPMPQHRKDLRTVAVAFGAALVLGLAGWLAGLGGSEPDDDVVGGGSSHVEVPQQQQQAPQPLLGNLQVNVNVRNAAVKIDGRRVGSASPSAPLNQRDLTLGYHTVEVSKAGYQSEQRRVQVQANEWTQVAISLQPEGPKVGSLKVYVNVPNAVVKIDGSLAGASSSSTPLRKSGLRAGRHQMVVSADGYETETRSIQIEAGREAVYRIELESGRPDPELVKKLQTELARIGYAVGAPDGIAGSKTITALKQFQRSQDLAVTGRVDQAMLDKLTAFRKTGMEFHVENACESPITLLVYYQDLRGNWKSTAWWNFDFEEKAYLAHQSLRIVAKKGRWYFYAKATDDTGRYWDGDKSITHSGKTYKTRKMDSTSTRNELRLTCT